MLKFQMLLLKADLIALKLYAHFWRKGSLPLQMKKNDPNILAKPNRTSFDIYT